MSSESLSVNYILDSNNNNISIEKLTKSYSEKENSSLNIKYLKIYLEKGLNLFFSQDKNFIALSPIIPINKSDILFKLYDLDNWKEKIEKEIKKILGEKNFVEIKRYKKKGIEIEKKGNEIKIIDNNFINDCKLLAKSNQRDCDMNVSDKISSIIYDKKINLKYKKSKENDKLMKAIIKEEGFYSDFYKGKQEARLNVLIKFINKYIKEKDAKEIIDNILESIKNSKNSKVISSKRYEKYLKAFGGDRKLLKKKRQLTEEEFNKRLPYFNMLDKDNKNNLIK